MRPHSQRHVREVHPRAAPARRDVQPLPPRSMQPGHSATLACHSGAIAELCAGRHAPQRHVHEVPLGQLLPHHHRAAWEAAPLHRASGVPLGYGLGSGRLRVQRRLRHRCGPIELHKREEGARVHALPTLIVLLDRLGDAFSHPPDDRRQALLNLLVLVHPFSADKTSERALQLSCS